MRVYNYFVSYQFIKNSGGGDIDNGFGHMNIKYRKTISGVDDIKAIVEYIIKRNKVANATILNYKLLAEIDGDEC
jgi:hypothetical protein